MQQREMQTLFMLLLLILELQENTPIQPKKKVSIGTWFVVTIKDLKHLLQNRLQNC